MNEISGHRNGGLTAYVAGSSREIDRVRRVMWLVRAAGFIIVFDWTGPEGEIRRSWGEDERERGARLAQRELRAAIHSNLFVLVAPPEPMGTGCFIEMGAALARGTLCLVENSERRESVFFCHPLVTVVFSLDALVEHISE